MKHSELSNLPIWILSRQLLLKFSINKEELIGVSAKIEPRLSEEGLILSVGSEKHTLIGTTVVLVLPGNKLSVGFGY